jgi:hypothetical protein
VTCIPSWGLKASREKNGITRVIATPSDRSRSRSLCALFIILMIMSYAVQKKNAWEKIWQKKRQSMDIRGSAGIASSFFGNWLKLNVSASRVTFICSRGQNWSPTRASYPVKFRWKLLHFPVQLSLLSSQLTGVNSWTLFVGLRWLHSFSRIMAGDRGSFVRETCLRRPCSR